MTASYEKLSTFVIPEPSFNQVVTIHEYPLRKKDIGQKRVGYAFIQNR